MKLLLPYRLREGRAVVELIGRVYALTGAPHGAVGPAAPAGPAETTGLAERVGCAAR